MQADALTLETTTLLKESIWELRERASKESASAPKRMDLPPIETGWL